MEQDQKNTLDDKICPFTTEELNIEGGFNWSQEDVTVYKCSIDNGLARGGSQREGYFVDGHYRVATSPCPLKYAETCPLYNEHKG